MIRQNDVKFCFNISEHVKKLFNKSFQLKNKVFSKNNTLNGNKTENINGNKYKPVYVVSAACDKSEPESSSETVASCLL